VEARIAARVGLGQTNGEVAPAVFLSVLTVESHLGRIYSKLDLRSRTELSRLVGGDFSLGVRQLSRFTVRASGALLRSFTEAR
jgi:hypothetical protein